MMKFFKCPRCGQYVRKVRFLFHTALYNPLGTLHTCSSVRDAIWPPENEKAIPPLVERR